MRTNMVIALLSVATLASAQPRNIIAERQLSRSDQSRIFSVTDSSSILTKVGQWGWGPCYAVAVKGNYAYIGNGTMLQVLDVSNPDSPKAVGELLTGSMVENVVVSGNYAYTIFPFRIINISDPAIPVLVSTYQLPGGYPPTAITVQGNCAYIGDFYGNVFIVDISNPSVPQALGSMLTDGERVQSIIVKDTVVYAVSGDAPGINVYSISNPASPTFIRLAVSGPQPGTSLAINNRYLYFGTAGRFSIFDISDLPNPRYVNSLVVSSIVHSISIADSVAFVTLDGMGFAEVDLADTNNIHIISNIMNPYSFQNAAGVGVPLGEAISLPYAYLACSTGLWIVAVGGLGSLNSVSFFPTAWYVNKIAVDSSFHAFLAELYGGLKILDVSDPSSPKLVGEYYAGEQVRDVAVANDLAYLLCDSDLQVIDVSDPGFPKLLGKASFHDTATSTIDGYFDFLCLHGLTVYAARKSQRVFAVDVGDPSHPVIESTRALRGIPVGISQANSYLYIADYDTGIQVFTISDPNTPSEEEFLSIAPLRGVRTEKNKLFVSGLEGKGLGSAAFAEYDITDALNPVLKYLVDIPGGIMTFVDLKTEDDFLYLAYGPLITASISDPDSGRIVCLRNAENLISGFNSVAVSDRVVIAGYLGVTIFKNTLDDVVEMPRSLPGTFELFQNFPNPFNSATLIEYQLSDASYVTLKIYDILGRDVKTVLTCFQRSGSYVVPFDASKFSSGVYFYRLDATSVKGERHILTKKMELLK